VVTCPELIELYDKSCVERFFLLSQGTDKLPKLFLIKNARNDLPQIASFYFLYKKKQPCGWSGEMMRTFRTSDHIHFIFVCLFFTSPGTRRPFPEKLFTTSQKSTIMTGKEFELYINRDYLSTTLNLLFTDCA